MNETLNRLERTDEKLAEQQNKMISLERMVQQMAQHLQYKSNVLLPNPSTHTSSLPSIASQTPINQMKSKSTQTIGENWSQTNKQSLQLYEFIHF